MVLRVYWESLQKYIRFDKTVNMCEPCTGVNDWHYRFTLTLFRGQIVPNQIDPFYSLIVSLFQCKLDVKRAFLASWLK